MRAAFLSRRCALFLVALTAFGQGPKGSITGRVLDPGGAAFSGATVQAKMGTQTFKGSSGAGGVYTVGDLPAGDYDISVNVAGLRAFEKKAVSVAGKSVELDIHLQESTQLSTLGEDALAAIANAKRHAPPSGPVPRTMDGKPDLSGVWWRPTVTEPGKPEWLADAERVAKQRLDNNGKDNPQARCLPSAATRLGPLWELVQSKSFLVVISDDESPGFHQIYLDGRAHPQDPNPAWYGHNTGRWDGDTLVVDRIGFDERVWLDAGAHPHSEKLHIVERYKRIDLGHLEAEITVEDPGVLAKPWVLKQVSDLANEEISEFICAENNRDVEHLVGK